MITKVTASRLTDWAIRSIHREHEGECVENPETDENGYAEVDLDAHCSACATFDQEIKTLLKNLESDGELEVFEEHTPGDGYSYLVKFADESEVNYLSDLGYRSDVGLYVRKC